MAVKHVIENQLFYKVNQQAITFEDCFLFQVTRRLLHRPLLVYRMPNLLCIDGIPVTTEEKTKAELYFIEQQVCGLLLLQDSVRFFLPRLYLIPFLKSFAQWLS